MDLARTQGASKHSGDTVVGEGGLHDIKQKSQPVFLGKQEISNKIQPGSGR